MERPCNSMFLYAIHVLGKNLLHKHLAKILLSNELAGVFDHQHVWRKSINISDFLHEDSHQGNVAFLYGWCGLNWSAMPTFSKPSGIVLVAVGVWLV